MITKMTFFSGTDLGTLQEEGSDMNNFLSLIVNNAGQYTAAITRKVKHIPHVTETLEYEFFGDGTINLGTDEYDAVESYEIEYFFLDIEKPTVNIGYTDLFDRINEISNSKVINIASKKENTNNNFNLKSNLIIPSTVQEPILEGKLPFEGLSKPKAEVDEEEELIDYAMRSGAPMEVVENLQELEDEGEIYETIEDVWPDYPTKEDFLFNEDEY